ncbi:MULTISPECIES: hypothetical protein [unclassified Streptomyces]|uniref:hypothetical protein n=1 Tax=unclassified Streptomyces TaxID=2593676 RepID=UPI002DD7D7E5|nr:hypothetical protein [Streptomyces sp. NBC_01445]WSE07017.1 hypothetical protein OG574_28985 [Streptomyces sp. NBC_01445]
MRREMFALRAIGAAAVLVTLPVAAAHAEGGGSDGSTGSITVTPYAPAPGTQVDLRVSGCKDSRGKVYSDAFETPGDLARSADQPTLTTQARIRSSATPGVYEIKVTCDGADDKVRGSVQVLQPGRPTPTPTAAVHAGGGGTAQVTAAHTTEIAGVRGEGPGTRHAVIGLVLAAVAAVAVAFRGVRRRRSD